MSINIILLPSQFAELWEQENPGMEMPTEFIGARVRYWNEVNQETREVKGPFARPVTSSVFEQQFRDL
jgi:hypothetical protein